jgi:hypothetical protein
VFIGFDEGDQDRLIFHTLTHVRYLKDTKESDQAEVSYFLEEEEEGEGIWALKKRVQSPPDAEPEEGGVVMTILTGVREFNLRYYDSQKGEFFPEWDSTAVDYANRLPRAVEILLILENPMEEEEGEGHRFLTTAFLGMAPGPNDF